MLSVSRSGRAACYGLGTRSVALIVVSPADRVEQVRGIEHGRPIRLHRTRTCPSVRPRANATPSTATSAMLVGIGVPWKCSTFPVSRSVKSATVALNRARLADATHHDGSARACPSRRESKSERRHGWRHADEITSTGELKVPAQRRLP